MMKKLLLAALALCLLGTGISTNKSILTSSSATTCTSITASAANLYGVHNTGNPQVVTITLYDEAGSPTCAAADQVFQATFGPGQVVSWYGSVPMSNGIAYKLSAALGDNVVVEY